MGQVSTPNEAVSNVLIRRFVIRVMENPDLFVSRHRRTHYKCVRLSVQLKGDSIQVYPAFHCPVERQQRNYPEALAGDIHPNTTVLFCLYCGASFKVIHDFIAPEQER